MPPATGAAEGAVHCVLSGMRFWHCARAPSATPIGVVKEGAGSTAGFTARTARAPGAGWFAGAAPFMV